MAELCRDDAAWPSGLGDLKSDQPARLHVAGRLPNLGGAVAIVGTRYANEDAVEFTRKLAAAVAIAGHAVVSGGAQGIDAAAHRGCLEGGGATVAVLATGLVRAYPSGHDALFRAVAAQGAAISEEFEPQALHGHSFLHRNRLIAALAPTLVVVQAPLRSGALSTARWARKLGRRVLAVPAAPWDVRGMGCLAWLRSGAQICTSVTDVLSLPASGPGAHAEKGAGRSKKSNKRDGLFGSAQAVCRLLRTGSRCPDELSVCLDMPAAKVQEALLSLQLMGRIRRRVDGTYELARKS